MVRLLKSFKVSRLSGSRDMTFFIGNGQSSYKLSPEGIELILANCCKHLLEILSIDWKCYPLISNFIN